jgi:chromosome partitioning protein
VIGRAAHATLVEQRIVPLATQVFQRIVFAESVASGRLAFELDADSHAAREITALGAEVMGKAR